MPRFTAFLRQSGLGSAASMAGVLRCARTSPHTLPSSEWYTIVHSEAAEAVHAHDNCDGGKLQLQQLSTPSGYGGGLTKYPWALGEKSGLLPVVPSPPLLFFAVAPGLRPSPSYHPCVSSPRAPSRRSTPRRCTTRTSCRVPRRRYYTRTGGTTRADRGVRVPFAP